MSIQLARDIEARIVQKVEHGRFPDADVVIRAAMGLLDHHEGQMDALRAKLQIGLDELDRGEGIEWSPALMEQINREAEEMLRRGELPDPDVCP